MRQITRKISPHNCTANPILTKSQLFLILSMCRATFEKSYSWHRITVSKVFTILFNSNYDILYIVYIIKTVFYTNIDCLLNSSFFHDLKFGAQTHRVFENTQRPCCTFTQRAAHVFGAKLVANVLSIALFIIQLSSTFSKA